MDFLLNANVFIEYPLLKRKFGKLAIGQSIQLPKSLQEKICKWLDKTIEVYK